MKTYTFGLFDSMGQEIDSTNIDENNPEFAMELFTEFSKSPKEKYNIHENSGHYVMLMEEIEDEHEEYKVFNKVLLDSIVHDEESIKSVITLPKMELNDTFENEYFFITRIA